MKLYINLLILFIGQLSIAQHKYHIETIAFYNVENLFDTIDQPDVLDEKSPILEITSNRSQIYKKKLFNTAKVLNEIGRTENKNIPSIIGLAEIENKTVLNDLTHTDVLKNYNFQIVHYNSLDQRGIDVALLYNPKKFVVTNSEIITPKLYRNNFKVYTRDILWVTGYLNQQKTHVFVNHWPSRRGGKRRSSVLREKVAFTLFSKIQEIEKSDPEASIIIMGDFNDNPNNKSLELISKSKEINIYNPFNSTYKNGHHTLTYRDKGYLFDQILISENLRSKNFERFKFYKAGIYNPDYLTNQTGKYKGSPKRSFGNGTFINGYSDHYPVYIYLIKQVGKN
ncbi:endonuclease/exonuclease/phosphatase family protein [Flavobacteriaceae bacterium]|nr:endonuclease/exonuclease/phosphatase family protein [Flavobacteriaceae bacterium]